MLRKKKDVNGAIKEKLEYLGLDLENIPKDIMKTGSLEYRVSKTYDQTQNKIYRYVSIKDIEILLSPTNIADTVEEKYKKSSPLAEYLDNKNEDNIIKYTTFLNMLDKFSIKNVEKIEEEQEKLNKKIPFKVKYKDNYLWQIYYSENTDKYFMLVSTDDINFSTFFYVLKKKLEKKRLTKIFVPIKNIDYSTEYLKKSEFEDLANYMWLFTKEWPLIYEVYDKNEKLTIQIVGETEVYQKVKSPYKITLKSQEESVRFYKLLKAMFILQTELSDYFTFKTNISKNGEIEFILGNKKIEYVDIAQWLTEQYHAGENILEETQNLIETNSEKLGKLKQEIQNQETEYLIKEKQISTFLECKKTFFGKVKYFFKYGGKKKRNDQSNEKLQIDEIEEDSSQGLMPTIKKDKPNYTIEDILDLYKGVEDKEHKLRNLIMDINSLKLKNKNMQKKIENATSFIKEIDSHKKSIFEFWKYTNKDEMATLPEGEEEEVNIIQRITKNFDYQNDLEKFGQVMDELQRQKLDRDETDSIYIASTDMIDLLNKLKTSNYGLRDIEEKLMELKKEEREAKTLTDEEFDIFGGKYQDNTKIKQIKNKKHREIPKDKFNILEINKNTKPSKFKATLEKIIKTIETAVSEMNLPEKLPIYKALLDEKLDDRKINIFNINPEEEMQEAVNKPGNIINFYKINLPEGANAISYTNSMFFDNQNKTLPLGQDISTKILVDIKGLKLELKEKSTFRILEFENEKSDFSKVKTKSVKVYEFDASFEED